MRTTKKPRTLKAFLKSYKLGENLVSIAIVIIGIAIGLIGATIGGQVGSILIIFGIILAALGGVISGIFPS